MENRNGDLVSPQISVMGTITFADEENFKKDTPFCIKNHGVSFGSEPLGNARRRVYCHAL